MCAVVVSTSNPYKAIRVRIIDQCPECEHGSLDFSDKAFKALSNKTPDRIKITWALIPCDIDVNEFPALVKPNSPLKFQFKSGSTQFWGEVQVFNTRYPVAKVEFLKDGKYEGLSRRAYNYWSLKSGGFGKGPYTFRVTLADGSIIQAKNVEMVIPSNDEGDSYSSGSQTIVKQGSQSNNSASKVTTKKTTVRKTTTTRKITTTKKTTKKTTTKKTTTKSSTTTALCPNAILRQGYSCCEKNNCSVYYKDSAGYWGVTNNLKWCGIRNSCTNTSSNDSTCPKAFTNLGYKCCKGCNVVLRDGTGKWGVENNQWCGIRSTCK